MSFGTLLLKSVKSQSSQFDPRGTLLWYDSPYRAPPSECCKRVASHNRCLAVVCVRDLNVR
eukprot:4473946-Amphidinium_carterae.1